MHRDSLGTAAAIRPGEVNWMTAGRGIVHSERTASERRVGGERLHGLQCWVAMPAGDEEIAPSFAHHAQADLPLVAGDGKMARVVLVGGAAIDGPRFIWWNFVSSRRERIEQAKADWKLRRFDSVPGDETEFIPLPE